MSFLDFDKKQGTKLKKLGSTNTPLIASAVYTGALHFSTDFLYITGLCKADQDGFLVIEFSYDDTPDIIGDSSTEYFKDDPLNFKVPITAPYFRIKFYNGTIGQTTFKLHWFGSVQ